MTANDTHGQGDPVYAVQHSAHAIRPADQSTASDTERGLYGKYLVQRHDGKALAGGCFVVEYGDPFAVPALRAYALACEATHLELARDLYAIAAYIEDRERDGMPTIARGGRVDVETGAHERREVRYFPPRSPNPALHPRAEQLLAQIPEVSIETVTADAEPVRRKNALLASVEDLIGWLDEGDRTAGGRHVFIPLGHLLELRELYERYQNDD